MGVAMLKVALHLNHAKVHVYSLPTHWVHIAEPQKVKIIWCPPLGVPHNRIVVLARKTPQFIDQCLHPLVAVQTAGYWYT